MSDPQLKRIEEIKSGLEREKDEEREEAKSKMKGVQMATKRYQEYLSDKQKFSELERKNREIDKKLSQKENLEKHKYVAIDKILDYIKKRNYRFKDCIDDNKDEEGYDDIEKCLRELKSLISNEQKISDNEFVNVSIEIIYDIYNSNNIENIKELVNTWREKHKELQGGKKRKTKRGGKKKKSKKSKKSKKKKSKNKTKQRKR